MRRGGPKRQNVEHVIDAVQRDLLDPKTLIGALVWGVVFIGIAAILAAVVRKFAQRVESHLSDVTGLRFASAFAQVVVYVMAFILYTHLIPELRTLGTTLLAGVGIASVVLGLAAQNTLGNLVAGVSLVLYRPIRIGDNVQLNTPRGLTTATVGVISLGYTVLRDADSHEIIVPNSVMGSSVVIRLSGTSAYSNTVG
jgi:moderate conductance mechanosensitive channel